MLQQFDYSLFKYFRHLSLSVTAISYLVPGFTRGRLALAGKPALGLPKGRRGNIQPAIFCGFLFMELVLQAISL